MWATRKFWRYLLGTTFTLEMDHKPLEWLESHKQSHARSQRLERWSLELHAFNFNMAYRPGNSNQCADSLSRLPVPVVAWEGPLSKQQLLDAPDSVPTSSSWRKFPLRSMKSLTMIEHKKLIVVPQSLRQLLLEDAHDLAGHPGMDRTFTRLMQTAYWVDMAKDVGRYCSRCMTCQSTMTHQLHYNQSLSPALGKWWPWISYLFSGQ